MRPVADILALATLTLLLVAYQRHRNGWDLVGAGIVAVALASDLSRWPALRVQVGLAEVALLAVAAVAYFNLVGFPRLVVRHLRFGYRSAEWSFDRRLYDEKRALIGFCLSTDRPTMGTSIVAGVGGSWRALVELFVT